MWPAAPPIVRAMTPSEVASVLGLDQVVEGEEGRGPVVPVPMEMKPPPTRRGTGGPKLRSVVPVTQPVPTPPVKKEPPQRRVRKVV